MISTATIAVGIVVFKAYDSFPQLNFFSSVFTGDIFHNEYIWNFDFWI
ncbi:hypothetical protein FIU95_12530 [Microbulbifer sp. THAF38]|nr:hypothetical protein FIU95_12530 [Microbulbifer sp. THAF38]